MSEGDGGEDGDTGFLVVVVGNVVVVVVVVVVERVVVIGPTVQTTQVSSPNYSIGRHSQDFPRRCKVARGIRIRK